MFVVFRVMWLACMAAVLTSNVSVAAEKPQAVNGWAASTVAIAPTFYSDNVLLPQSYIRLISGSSAPSTFTVTIVGVPSGTTYGTPFTIAIPGKASVQYPLGELVKGAGETAGAFLAGDTGYTVFLHNTDRSAGYQHVVFDATNDLFENHSNCQVLLNDQISSRHSELLLTNVHTSKLGDNKYPSVIEFYNYAPLTANLMLDVYNGGVISATGAPAANSGKLTCTISNIAIASNSRLQLPMSTIEANPACVLDADQFYANVVVRSLSATTPSTALAHLVQVTKFNGTTNMTQACAINPVPPSASTTPTAYCGFVQQPTATGGSSFMTFIASVSTSNEVNVVAYGTSGSERIGFTGTGDIGTFGPAPSFLVNHTGSTSFHTEQAIRGTIENGRLEATYPGQFGTARVSATTAGCGN